LPHPASESLRKSLILLVLFVAILSQRPQQLYAQPSAAPESALQGRLIDPLSSERTRSSMLAIGSANLLDTYLSAEKYSGTELRYISTLTKNTRWHNIRQTIFHEGKLDVVSNRADNNDELGGMYRFQYHLRRQLAWANGFSLEAGDGIGAELGFLYNTRNSNNPAQAYAALQLLPSAAASQRIRVFNWPVRLRYEACVPLLGLAFSPNYGQSYYEIFSRGNYDHNIVPTTILSTPSLRHMLTADIPLSRKHSSALRIGYLGDYQQAELNNLKRHQYAHMLIIGITVTR
jgi:hypothetical protein